MFLKYSAIVWGTPAIFSLTCGLIDNQGVYAIYIRKEMQVCWFNNEKAQLYFFVLPVSFSLTLNIVLMGFSCLFGCLDILTHSTPVFSYLFVIFASLQGLYIAVAFVFNQRIFKQYKQLVRKKRTKRRQTNNDCNSTLSNLSNTRETKL